MIFAFGEMAFSPKILEYISRIAPRDKAALYMGSNFVPMAVGNFIGGLLSGKVYELTADKFSLLSREMEKWNVNLPAISDQFTLNDYYHRAAEVMGMDPGSLTDYLWLNYYPSRFGFILLGVGIATGLLLIVYDKILFRYR
jgi:POT family proton-dependent oligopeptide transporter